VSQQNVLVYCANGFQGHATVPALLAGGVAVRALVRDRERASPLTAAGAEIYVGDLATKDSLKPAHQGVDVVVLQTPAGEPPEATRSKLLNALESVQAAGITKIVVNTSVQFPRRIDELPQFAAKREVEDELLKSGLDVSIVRAPFLLSNLLLPYASLGIAHEDLLTYPVGSDVALSWAAPEDVGRMISIMISRGLYGLTLHAGSSAPVRGDELAGEFAAALERPIRYIPLPLDDFEAGVDAAVGPGIGRQVGEIFRFIAQHPDDREFVDRPFAVPPEFPPVEPMSIQDWVRAHKEAFTPD
jgi:uncharacterized protein YbjT (DUF2867 family)